MKINNVVVVIFLGVGLTMFQNCTSDSRLKEEPDFVLSEEFQNILTRFISSISRNDSACIFVTIKNIDANTAKYYLVAKKPLRSDFEVIGIPFTSTKVSETIIYFFNGIEKVLYQDTLFWKEHLEVFDDRKKQLLGIYETPIIKKEVYLYDDDVWRKEEKFDDMIFIGNSKDTLHFMQK